MSSQWAENLSDIQLSFYNPSTHCQALPFFPPLSTFLSLGTIYGYLCHQKLCRLSRLSVAVPGIVGHANIQKLSITELRPFQQQINKSTLFQALLLSLPLFVFIQRVIYNEISSGLHSFFYLPNSQLDKINCLTFWEMCFNNVTEGSQIHLTVWF